MSGSRVPATVTGLERLAVLIATVFGVGYAPVAPGSLASAVTVLVLWLVSFFEGRPGSASSGLVTLVGPSGRLTVAEAARGAGTPHAIVIDEVAGMILSVPRRRLSP